MKLCVLEDKLRRLPTHFLDALHLTDDPETVLPLSNSSAVSAEVAKPVAVALSELRALVLLGCLGRLTFFASKGLMPMIRQASVLATRHAAVPCSHK